MSKPIPKAIAGAVTLTVAVAALLAFSRGDGPRPDALSAATVPQVTGTNAPTVSGHAKQDQTSKSKSTTSQSKPDPVVKSTPTTSTTSAGSPATHGTPSANPTTSPKPSPSPSPTSGGGLLGLLHDVLSPGH